MGMNPVYYWLIENKPKDWPLKKVQILSGFIEQLSKEGAENLSPEKLAKKMGLARSHVVYYFKDQEALYREALLFIAQSAQIITIEKWMKASDSDKVWAILDGAFDWAEKLPEHACAFALLQYFAARREDYKTTLTQIRGEGRKRIAHSLQLMLKSSSFDEKRAMDLALHIQLLISSYIAEFSTTRQFSSLEESKKMCRSEILKSIQEATK